MACQMAKSRSTLLCKHYHFASSCQNVFGYSHMMEPEDRIEGGVGDYRLSTIIGSGFLHRMKIVDYSAQLHTM